MMKKNTSHRLKLLEAQELRVKLLQAMGTDASNKQVCRDCGFSDSVLYNFLYLDRISHKYAALITAWIANKKELAA